MKNLTTIYLALLLPVTLFVSSCNDDDDSQDPGTASVDFAGTYEYESAKFIDEVTFKTGDKTTTVPAGSSADAYVEVNINSSSPCEDSDDTELDLREGGKLFLTCGDDGGNEIESGTWAANGDKTQLTITFNASIPLSLTIENVRLEGDDDGGADDVKLYGNISNFPVPIDPSKPIDASNLQLISVDIVLDKED